MTPCQDTVESMIHDGYPFGEVEDYIETTAVPEDLKAALWLLAWSYQAAPIQRSVAREALNYARVPRNSN